MDAFLWAIGLLLVGLGLILLELFVPSGGVLGILAMLALVSAVIVALLEDWRLGMVMLLLVTVAAPLTFLLALRIWPHTPLGRLIFLRPKREEMDEEEQMDQDELIALIGQLGIARSNMRPSGEVRLGGRGYDAVSEGMPIDEGQAVKVVGVRMRRLVVRPSRETPPPAPARPRGGDESQGDDILAQPIEKFGIDSLEDPLK